MAEELPLRMRRKLARFLKSKPQDASSFDANNLSPYMKSNPFKHTYVANLAQFLFANFTFQIPTPKMRNRL